MKIDKRTSLTFDEWVEHGYRIKKGEKSKSRDAKGRPTFTMKQVWFVPENKRDIYLKPSQSSSIPPKEIVKAIQEKQKVEEDRHEFMDHDFIPADQQFSPEDEPPW